MLSSQSARLPSDFMHAWLRRSVDPLLATDWAVGLAAKVYADWAAALRAAGEAGVSGKNRQGLAACAYRRQPACAL